MGRTLVLSLMLVPLLAATPAAGQEQAFGLDLQDGALSGRLIQLFLLITVPASPPAS
jgi:hypothetical protein